MVFSLAKVYERRLEQNIRRHRLDNNIAPRKPQPRCDESIFSQNIIETSTKTSDKELMTRFIQDAADQRPVLVDNNTVNSNNNNQDSINNNVVGTKVEVPIDYLEMDGCSMTSDVAKPWTTKTVGKGLERVDSMESAFFTESESGLNA